MLNILAIISAVASAIAAVCSFIITKRNSKPRIKLEILNQDPFLQNYNLTLIRNFFYLDETQKNAIIHVEIENHSSMAGTITEIFIKSDSNKLLPPSQIATSYKDYGVQPLRFSLESTTHTERYNSKFMDLRQPITVKPFGYLIGFLFVPHFNIKTDAKKINVVLEYKIVGYNKTFSKKLTLTRVYMAPCEYHELPTPEPQQENFQED